MPDQARGGLDDCPYRWHIRRDGGVDIQWRGQSAGTVRGSAATKLIAQLEREDEAGQQRALAKVTGNFKRGNERSQL